MGWGGEMHTEMHMEEEQPGEAGKQAVRGGSIRWGRRDLGHSAQKDRMSREWSSGAASRAGKQPQTVRRL